MTKIIDGKAVAAELRADLAKEVANLKSAHGFVPGLAVVLVGEDPASKVYVKNKAAQTVEVGMNSVEHKLPAETPGGRAACPGRRASTTIPSVNGILVQLPLPKHINAEKVLNAIDPDKDVDGFHPVNVGRLWVGERSLVPCTPTGSVILAKSREAEPVRGSMPSSIGRSNIVGKPVAALLLRENCTVTVAHSGTRDLPAVVRQRRSRGRCRRHARNGRRPIGSAGRDRHRRRHQPGAQGRTARVSSSATSTTTIASRWPAQSRRCRAASGR